MRMVIATLAVLVGSVATAGCGGEAPAPSSSSSTSAAAVSTTTAAPTTPSQATGPETSNGQQYSVTTTTIEG
jgi:ABC-type glycerol-3-phosphate transport system substrate-binding protein